MNKIFSLSIFLFLTLTSLVLAMPVIQDINVQPPSLWLGEDATISLNCFDSENNTIEQVYASIAGPNVFLPTLYFTKPDESYSLFVNREYLDRTGQFDVTTYCQNNNSEVSNALTGFTVSKLTGYINSISPNPAFSGETMEIDFIVKKNEIKISSNATFNVFLNDQLKTLKVLPAYDSNKGWILKIDTPSSPGIYNIKVVAFYDRTSVTNYSFIEARNNVEFSIESLDKNWVKSNDNVTVTLKSLEEGSVIDLNKNNLNIKINSVSAEITTISKHDNLFDVKIIAPNLPYGRYRLDAYLNYNGFSYSSNRPVDYVVPIDGVILDANNKAMNVQIKFTQGSTAKLSLTTDSYGHYSGSLPPDNYDIEIDFPRSTLSLKGVPVQSFEDPIKYFYSDEFDVQGIRNAGLYSYEIDLSYSSTDIEMIYSEKNVVNENDLKIFKCSSWNSGKRVCNSDWTEVDGEIDTVRNQVRMTSTTLSTFIIGTEKSLYAEFSLDKDAYYLNDKIAIRGLVKDEDRNVVSNAKVELKVKSTQISSKFTADENGIFSVEIPTPDREGKYEMSLNARKYPYKEFDDVKNFELIKSKSIFIDFPDTIKISKEENLTQELNLINNGQADANDLKIYLEGIPENYYNFSENINLKTGEKKTLYVNFFIPFFAKSGISSATLKVEGNNITEEKVFGLNIVEKNENNNETLPTTGLVSGFGNFNISGISYSDIGFIAVFAIICFSTAIILKKRRIRKSSRDHVKGFLFDVRNFLKKSEIEPEKRGYENSYDRLILTEFPNFLKYSKKINKIKNVGDEQW